MIFEQIHDKRSKFQILNEGCVNYDYSLFEELLNHLECFRQLYHFYMALLFILKKVYLNINYIYEQQEKETDIETRCYIDLQEPEITLMRENINHPTPGCDVSDNYWVFWKIIPFNNEWWALLQIEYNNNERKFFFTSDGVIYDYYTPQKEKNGISITSKKVYIFVGTIKIKEYIS